MGKLFESRILVPLVGSILLTIGLGYLIINFGIDLANGTKEPNINPKCKLVRIGPNPIIVDEGPINNECFNEPKCSEECKINQVEECTDVDTDKEKCEQVCKDSYWCKVCNIESLPKKNRKKTCKLVSSPTPINGMMCFEEPECTNQCKPVTQKVCRPTVTEKCEQVCEDAYWCKVCDQ